MTEGEPPDETGENGTGRESADDTASERDESGPAAGPDGDEDRPTDGTGPGSADGTDHREDGEQDAVDPGEEVEAAVREVMGPDAIEDGTFDDSDGDVANGDSDGEVADDGGDDGPVGETDGERDGARSDVDAAGEAADETDEPPRGSPTEGEAATRTEGAATQEGAMNEGAMQEEAMDEVATQEETRDGAAATEVPEPDVPADVRKYDRFKKIDGGTYDRANEFLRDRTYITAREWAMARLCADFRTETGVEMTKIGENLPELVPFMTDTYTPQAVNQARAAFEEKVRKAGATFLYGAMCDFFTAEELDDVMYEATEVAKFLLEVEGVELSVDEELAAEDHISEVMRDVREHSAALRHDEVTCPECGHSIDAHE